MTDPVKHPTNANMPDEGTNFQKDWILGQGESETREWPNWSDKSQIEAKYEALKGDAGVGSNITRLTYKGVNGRRSLVARFSAVGGDDTGDSPDIRTIEELYAVDIIKDIREAPYFAVTVDGAKGLPLSDDNMSFVAVCAENKWTEDEIDAYDADNPDLPASMDYANWSTGMKELRYHMIHGVDSYFETAFVLRRSRSGVRTALIQATFTGINEVASPDPTFKTDMDQLVQSLPAGEWLYKPPQVEYMEKGKWRVDQEWHWATKWSIVYGGTWNL
jgi:hypothetical protein